MSILAFAAMRATSTTSDSDPFDSPLYLLSWIVVPLLAAAATLLRSKGHRPIAWVACLAVPWMALVFGYAVTLDAPEGDANLWFLGEILILLQAALAYVSAMVALRIRQVHFAPNG